MSHVGKAGVCFVRVCLLHELSSSPESRFKFFFLSFFRFTFLLFFFLFVFVLMAVTVISAPVMMSVQNIANIEFFFRVRRDREMSFTGSSTLNEIIPILPKQTRSFQDP